MGISFFNFNRTPRIIFGAGKLSEIGSFARRFGKTALVITGAQSLNANGALRLAEQKLHEQDIRFFHSICAGEPSPELIDSAVNQFGSSAIDIVIAIGGGSAIDTGKAISAMLTIREPVMHFLESVGTRSHPGTKIPFIAVPTTAGTGSEASGNTVLSRTGPDGFKKSLRHENFVPDLAVIDPCLALSCPPDVTAACGMDTLTQLIESYVSPKASLFTDALVGSAFGHLRDNLIRVASTDPHDIEARGAMACASLISGIALANAGLGVVHGFASSLGGLFEIPHGVICGTLLGPCTRATIDKLRMRDPQSLSLRKYAQAGAALSGRELTNIGQGCRLLVDCIENWTRKLHIPNLAKYKVTESDCDRIAKATENKNNPVQLDPADLTKIILTRLH